MNTEYKSELSSINKEQYRVIIREKISRGEKNETQVT